MGNPHSIEIDKLDSLLSKAGVPFDKFKRFDGWQIVGEDWDVICHKYSYGHENGLLETYGSIVPNTNDDMVEGWLTAEEVFERLKDKWRKEETMI